MPVLAFLHPNRVHSKGVINKMVRITRPLFSDTASGKIKGMGSYRKTRAGTVHLINHAWPNPNSTRPSPVNAQHLAIAKRQHAQIAPTQILIGGKLRWLILPRWPEFWVQYLVDNDLPFSGHALNGTPTIGINITSTAHTQDTAP